MGLLVAVLWLLEAVDQASGNALDALRHPPAHRRGAARGLHRARSCTAAGQHLAANTVPFFVLGVIVLLDGWRRWFTVTLWVVVVSGATVWLISPPGSVTLGASGIVFGWLTYLILRGFYTRAPGQIALGVVVFLFYGGLLLGVLPTDRARVLAGPPRRRDRWGHRGQPPATASGRPALGLTTDLRRG